MSQTARLFLDPFTPPGALARWTTILLIASVAVAWIGAGVDLAQLRLLLQARGGEAVDAASRTAQSTVGAVVVWVEAALWLTGGAAFVGWLFQARVNVRALGARRLAYPREWAWGAFLVPLLNLVRPYQVVREVWQASDPRSLDPFAWRGRPVPALLPAWWVACLATLALAAGSAALFAGAPGSLAGIALATVVSIAAQVAWAAAACLACLIVGEIDDAQEQKWSRQRREESGASAA